ncbi:MAG: LLM class flavin-dependent oxidoreductase, partial [Chloroflexi bacterium]|nr:LLM class flavin-dependent oxidoreductase [Chloroflexota bacterium]
RGRYREAADLILNAWSNDCFSHEGKFWQMKNVELHPRPVQRPHPPVWLAGSSPESLHWAGESGFNILTVAHPFLPDVQRAGVAAWREGLKDGGHDASKHHCQLFVRLYVDEDRERGRSLGQECLKRYDHISSTTHGRRPGSIMACDPEYDWAMYERQGRNVYGNPDDVIAGIKASLENYDYDTFSCIFNFGGLPHEDIVRSMKLFAREVMPAFQ